MQTYLAQAAVAAFVTALVIVMLRRPAHRWGLVDAPGGRKRHMGDVPLTGGIAIAAGSLAGLAVSFSAFGPYTALFGGLLLLTVVGVLDDLGEMSANTKMLFQVIAAVLLTSWGNTFLTNLGDLFGRGPIDTRNWAIPLTVFATLALINAVNMLDGIDGLAGGIVFVSLLGMFASAWIIWDANAAKILIVLAGAVAGFLLFNLPHRWRGRRRVFMGDAGSMALGFALSWFAVQLTQRAADPVPPPVMLWIAGLLLMDVFTVTVRRLARRRSPLAPQRDHIHHMLIRRGLPPGRTLAALVAAQALLGATGIALWRLGASDMTLFFGFVAAAVLYFAVFFFPSRRIRFGSRNGS